MSILCVDESGACKFGEGTNRLKRAWLVSVVLHLLILAKSEALVSAMPSASGAPTKILQVLRLPESQGAIKVSQSAEANKEQKSRTRVVVPTRTESRAPPEDPKSFNGADLTANGAVAESIRTTETAIRSSNIAATLPQLEPQISSRASPREISASSIEDGVRAYRIALAINARRNRDYPQLATELDIDGRAEIEIRGTGATLPVARIAQSSGNKVLDQAALDILDRSIKTIALPVALSGRTFSILLPVEFRTAP